MGFLEKFFHLKEHKTTVKTEVMAGITTFMTMAYILVVNPNVLGATGMDTGALLTATCIAAFIGTACMALFANYPFALAPGMGLNAYFAYTVVLQMGYSWKTALLAVLVEGLVFIVLSLVNVREAIFDAIPMNIKLAVTGGIGLFIAFLGLQNAGVIVADANTLVKRGDIKSVAVALALIGTIITIAMVIKNVKGALLWGILITWGLGIVCQLLGWYQGDSLIPAGIVSMPASLSPIAFQFSFDGATVLDFIVVVFSFLIVNLFDTVGTLVGVSSKAGLLDKDGKLPRVRGALLADAVGTTAGATLGTSTVTTFVESASGVADGGRTGLTSMTTAFLFLAALFFTPIIQVIPTFATTPALIVVGLFMMENITRINFSDYTEGFPAFMTILMMVVAYSISEGLIFGILSYVILKVLTGKAKELNGVIVVTSILFLIKLLLG